MWTKSQPCSGGEARSLNQRNGENDDKNKTFQMYGMPDLHDNLLLAAFRRKYHEAIPHPRRCRLAEGAGDQRLPGL
jgi:hypothetical protein